MKISRTVFAFLLLFAASAIADEPATGSAFFAMNTAAKGGPDFVVPMLKELGYAGLGGAAGDAAMPEALRREGLRFFNAYHVRSFDAETPMPDASMKHIIDLLEGQNSAVWLGIKQVLRAGQPLAGEEAEGVAVESLRALADYAEPRGVRIALYPHTGFWNERFEHNQRVAEKVGRKSVGITFNLCHWLRVEGSERDPGPVLAAALPWLMFVTINGADHGDTQHMGWDRLIQPLGRGSYDVSAFLTKLDTVGYRGPIGLQGYGIQMEPRELLTISMRAWREMHATAPR